MTNFSDKHRPTPEFRERLSLEISRAFRSDQLFGIPSAPAQTRRVTIALGIAAGVVLTLATGMVLGASASYASAAVVDERQREASTSTLTATRELIAFRLDLARAHYDRVQAAFEKGAGTPGALGAAAAQLDTLEASIARIDLDLSELHATTPPPRSALAILPIKTVVSALSCPPAPLVAARPRVATPTVAAMAASQIAPEAGTAAAPTPAPQPRPDRAKIAALATQHVPDVVRGDTASEYIVMVLDSADNHIWSTHGSGNLAIAVGGDPRTAAERRAYAAEHAAEYGAAAVGRGGGGGGWVVKRGYGDTVAIRFRDTVFMRGYRDTMVFVHRTMDSLGLVRGRLTLRKPGVRGTGDSAYSVFSRSGAGARLDSVASDLARVTVARGGGGAGGRGGGGARGGGSNTDANAGTTYTMGWTASANGPLFNQAAGLEDNGGWAPLGAVHPGGSGIAGLHATSVAMAESYRFAAGELAPHALRIMVVHLVAGTIWTGR
jgi:hypothetical protein